MPPSLLRRDGAGSLCMDASGQALEPLQCEAPLAMVPLG